MGRGIHILTIRIFGFAIGILMICTGVLFLWAPGSIGNIPEQQRTILGVVVILYGLYRAFSTYFKSRHGTDRDII